MVGSERRDERVVVAIDRGKGSQAALKWAVDNLVTSGETLTLVHVKLKQTLNGIVSNTHFPFIQIILNKQIKNIIVWC